MSDVSLPQAGWYADPEDPSGERWWNGSGWSDHKRPSTVASVPPPPMAVVNPPGDTGFSFGSPAPAAPRPDPYAPPAAPTYASPAYSPYAPAPYGATAAQPSSNALAVAGLIVSIAGVIFGIAALVGIVLSILGLVEARKREAAGTPNPGRGLAIAGIVVGGVVALGNLLLIVVYFAFVFNVGYPY